MSVKITYYLEVISSWCYWAEPAWSELKTRYPGQVEFSWKIAQMPPEAYPVSKQQCEWFYKRSGTIMRSPFMLNSGWMEPEIKDYLVPNLVAEAARDFGCSDDKVRLALAEAAVRRGEKVGRWEIAASIAAKLVNVSPEILITSARSTEVAERVRRTTDEFHSLQVTQRPTFLIENSIGDRAVFSGIAKAEPLAAAIDALMRDEVAYLSWNAHFGNPPAE
jgi:predicted DsbA family dithiol-disulfide isomerase